MAELRTYVVRIGNLTFEFKTHKDKTPADLQEAVQDYLLARHLYPDAPVKVIAKT